MQVEKPPNIVQKAKSPKRPKSPKGPTDEAKLTGKEYFVEVLPIHCSSWFTSFHKLSHDFTLHFIRYLLFTMDAKNVERSKLVQRQKQQRQELEKKIKKLKGAMKEAAQKELETMEKEHEEELAAFDGSKGGESKDESKAEAEAAPAPAAQDSKKFRDRNWSGLSKKELEEECATRGLGKKGSKEDLVQKLIVFQQELASKAAAEAKDSTKGGYPAAETKAVEDAEAHEDDEEEDDEEDEEDEDDEEDDEEDEMQEVDQEEMEKQGKREKAVQKAIQFLLMHKCQDARFCSLSNITLLVHGLGEMLTKFEE
eukprot:s1485_g10.t2